MHETGIAQSILDIAIDTAHKNSADKITLISVMVGKMAAVDESSLRFAFDALKVGTIAGGALLEYESVPLRGRCVDCSAESDFEGYFLNCPICGSQKVSLIAGEELSIKHIEVE